MELSAERREPGIYRRLRSLPARWTARLIECQSRRADLAVVATHHVFTRPLGPGSIVLDLGAHTGEFSRELVRRYGCTCYAVEPVPALFSQIESGPRLKKLRLAVDGTGGEVLLHLSANPQANSLFPEIADRYGGLETLAVTATSLDELLAGERLPYVDLLKLDIEGAEVRVLAMASEETLQRIGQITVEFHDFIAGLGAGGSIRAVKRRLARAGFLCLVLSKAWGHHGDVLFLNLRRHPLGWRERLNLFLLLHATLHVRGLIHVLRGRVT